MQTQKATRILAALLAVFLLAGLAPVQAFAAAPAGNAAWTAQAEAEPIDAPAEGEAPGAEAPAEAGAAVPPEADEPPPQADVQLAAAEQALAPAAEGGDFVLAAEAGATTVGQTFNLDFSAFTEVAVPADAAKATLSWKYMLGSAPDDADPNSPSRTGYGAGTKSLSSGADLQAVLFSTFTPNQSGARYRSDFADAGNVLYCKIVLEDNAATPLATYTSNPVSMLLPLNASTAVAGELIKGGNAYFTNRDLGFEWYTVDESNNLVVVSQGSGTFSALSNDLLYYMPKDADVGKALFLRLTDAAGVGYDSERVAVAASAFTETFDFTGTSFSVGDVFSTSGTAFSWGIQGFSTYHGNLYTETSVSSPNITYTIQLMTSDDEFTSDGDAELAAASGTRRDLQPLTYTFKSADAGKYVYVKLTSDDLRQPAYQSGLVPVVAKKLPLNPGASLYVGASDGYVYATLNTTDVPGFSQGYTYQYLRTTGEEGDTPVVVAEGAATTANLPNYAYSDADIGCRIYAEVTKDGVTTLSETTGTVLPRRLKLTGGSAMGDAVRLGNEAGYQDTLVPAGALVEYDYYLTASADGTGAQTSVKSDDVQVAAGGRLHTAIPAYTLRGTDAGQYLNLRLVIGGHTYTLHQGEAVTAASLALTGQAYEGHTIGVQGYSAYYALEPGMRYEWRAKDTQAAEPAATDKVLASGTTTANAPGYTLTAGEAGKYVYLALIPARDAPYYSANAIGPVEAVARLTGTLTVGGKVQEGEKLTATLTIDGVAHDEVEGVTVKWYYAEPGKDPRQFATGWTCTIPAAAADCPIFAVAEGDGYDFHGSLTSWRTQPVQGRLSREVTGIQSVSARWTGPEDIGFVVAPGADFGKREPLTFEVTLHGSGAAALPANAVLRLEATGADGKTYYDYFTPAGGDEKADGVTFAGVSFGNLAAHQLRGGAGTVTISLVEKVGSTYTPYEAYPAPVPVVALAEVAIDAPAAVAVVRGGSTLVKATATPANAVFGFELVDPDTGEGITGLAAAGGKISAEAGSSATKARLVVTAVAGRQYGSASVDVTVVAAEDVKPAASLAISGKDAAKAKLEALMVGCTGDPLKTGEKLNTTLRLGATVSPADATANYTLLWESDNPAGAEVDGQGLVRVKAAGETVKISVALCGADGAKTALADSITFTTATPRYAPQAIVYGAKAITMPEQTARYLASDTATPGLPALKMKYLVDGRTTRTLRAPTAMFTYAVEDERIASVDADGYLHAIAPGETNVTIAVAGLDSVEPIIVPLVVKQAKFTKLSFAVNGRPVEAQAVNGMLRGELVLYEGGYTMPAAGFALEDGLAWITTEAGGLATRDAGLENLTLKLKRYTANKAANYTLTLPNKQKLVLAVTVANTQPAFLTGAKLFNDLDTPAAVQFGLTP